ncbi:MAG TPA: SET domain-containing protein-lysine N-methyltransferase, partial [Candidatus Polarisedimenticolia bacterium]|nr:SET domain-containing protein-lysine N-methyltransferase [Candidatus Polarisedimenticolia bacterium]
MGVRRGSGGGRATRRQAPGEAPPLVLRPSSLHGRGAFATRRIARGERVVEYLGERITHAEADARYDDAAMEHHHTFLMVATRRVVIDAAVGGNDARFINHSCDPNCEIVTERGRVFIDAIRAIEPGEELTYDYAYEREPGDDAVANTRYPCRCGASSCRGTIL